MCYNLDMGRPRKRHIQQPLFKQHGGKRKGAGRPTRRKRPSERHERRPPLRMSEPVHVTVRVLPTIGSLRKHDMFLAIREATICVAKLDNMHIVHMSIQGTHLHLIVEAVNRLALAKGMQAFLISAAKQINRVYLERTGKKRRGSVFTDRYHARIMRTPREVRNCIAYVLNNWRHHGEHRKVFAASWNVDPFSSAISFTGWKELEDVEVMWRGPEKYQPLIVWKPTSFLLSTLWIKHGLIRFREMPGGHHGDE
jgi:REP element-mobilizing transposase RayT